MKQQINIYLILLLLLSVACNTMPENYIYNYDWELIPGDRFMVKVSKYNFIEICGNRPTSYMCDYYYYIYKDGIQYDVAIEINKNSIPSENVRIKHIWCYDKNVKIAGYSIGDTIKGIKTIKKQRVTPMGYWYGKYVELPEKYWYADIAPDSVIRRFLKISWNSAYEQIKYNYANSLSNNKLYDYAGKIDIGEYYYGKVINHTQMVLPFSNDSVKLIYVYKNDLCYKLGINDLNNIVYIEYTPNKQIKRKQSIITIQDSIYSYERLSNGWYGKYLRKGDIVYYDKIVKCYNWK